MNTNARQLLSDAKFYEAYSRFDSNLDRYETWQESVHHVMQMHRTQLESKLSPELSSLLDEVETAYASKEILGAQRALQCSL